MYAFEQSHSKLIQGEGVALEDHCSMNYNRTTNKYYQFFFQIFQKIVYLNKIQTQISRKVQNSFQIMIPLSNDQVHQQGEPLDYPE
ncbi:hypothetical protein pb186bvf_004909 [Paramecium bursaria]